MNDPIRKLCTVIYSVFLDILRLIVANGVDSTQVTSNDTKISRGEYRYSVKRQCASRVKDKYVRTVGIIKSDI